MRNLVGLMLFCATVMAAAAATNASAAVIPLTDFEAAAADSNFLFRLPSFSGSTAANLVTTANGGPNVQRVSGTFPAGLDGSGAQVGETQFQFVDEAQTRWLRHTTFNAPGMPNPQIDLREPLSFDVYSSVPVSMSLLIRETGGEGPVGANGGAAGGIEFVGASSFAGPRGGASAGPVGQEVPANQWTTLTFDIPNEVVASFAGTTADSILEGDWGVLEALAITSTGDPGPITLYYDNLRQGVVPEPSSAAAVALAMLALCARRRRA